MPEAKLRKPKNHEHFRATVIIPPQEFAGMISKASRGGHKALLTFLYLTGSRVSEVVSLKCTTKSIIVTNNILKDENGMDYPEIYAVLPVLKKKNVEFRKIPLVLNRSEWELCKLFFVPYWEHASAMFENGELETNQLFPLNRRVVYRICMETIGKSPHWFRHHRASMIAMYSGGYPQVLKDFFRWSDMNIAYQYTKDVLTAKKLLGKTL